MTPYCTSGGRHEISDDFTSDNEVQTVLPEVIEVIKVIVVIEVMRLKMKKMIMMFWTN